LVRKTRGGADKVLVAESGVHTREDVERLAKCSAQAILVGESLMRNADVGAKMKELLGS
jgi:indole-3-glycerol phosphate synthase